MSERIEYFDMLRGLAIIGVVAIHSSTTGLQFADTSVNFNFTIIWRNLLNFSVPMFVAISGYFLAKKSIRCPDDYFSFLKKSIFRVYIPLIFWSVLWLVGALLIQNKPIHQEVIKVVTFQSIAPYYYIALIIQYYLLLPILQRFANNIGLVIAIVASLLMVCIIYFFRYYIHISLPLIIYAGNFATWLMFFVLGLYFGSSLKIEVSNRLLVILTLVFYMLSCVESYVLIAIFHQAGNAVTAVKASSFMYSFTLMILLFKNQNSIKSNVLKSIGDMSFGIYLIHMFALAFMSMSLFRFFPALQEITIAYQFILIILVTVSSYLCISLVKNLCSSRFRLWIGFK